MLSKDRATIVDEVRSRTEALLRRSRMRVTLSAGPGLDCPIAKNPRSTALVLSSDGQNIEVRLHGSSISAPSASFSSYPVFPDDRPVREEDIERAARVAAEELTLEENKRLLALLAYAGQMHNEVYTAADPAALAVYIQAEAAKRSLGYIISDEPRQGCYIAYTPAAGLWSAALFAKPLELRDGWCAVLKETISIAITRADLVIIGRPATKEDDAL